MYKIKDMNKTQIVLTKGQSVNWGALTRLAQSIDTLSS